MLNVFVCWQCYLSVCFKDESRLLPHYLNLHVSLFENSSVSLIFLDIWRLSSFIHNHSTCFKYCQHTSIASKQKSLQCYWSIKVWIQQVSCMLWSPLPFILWTCIDFICEVVGLSSFQKWFILLKQWWAEEVSVLSTHYIG